MDQDDAFMDIDQQGLIGSSTTTFSAQPNNARRAPVMGNRGLESQHRVQREQERSRTKSKTFPQKEPKSSSRSSPRSSRRSGTAEKSNSGSSGVVQVAALDERNLKKPNSAPRFCGTGLPRSRPHWRSAALCSLGQGSSTTI